MEKVYTGKTKDVYRLNDNLNRLVFKDDVTGTDGVFDPGSNTVGLKIDGAGFFGLKMSEYLFKIIEKNGIKTHYVSSDLENLTMDVLPVNFFGNGIEVICRYIATGSFIRRYGLYVTDASPLDGYIEISLKDDLRGDPFISQELLEKFGILKIGEYDEIINITRNVCEIIKINLSKKDVELYDIKLEFGKSNNNDIILIDEISGGNMRAYKNGVNLSPIELSRILTT